MHKLQIKTETPELLYFLEKQFPQANFRVEVFYVEIPSRFEYQITVHGELCREIMIRANIFNEIHKLHGSMYINY